MSCSGASESRRTIHHKASTWRRAASGLGLAASENCPPARVAWRPRYFARTGESATLETSGMTFFARRRISWRTSVIAYLQFLVRYQGLEQRESRLSATFVTVRPKALPVNRSWLRPSQPYRRRAPAPTTGSVTKSLASQRPRCAITRCPQEDAGGRVLSTSRPAQRRSGQRTRDGWATGEERPAVRVALSGLAAEREGSGRQLGYEHRPP